MEFKDFLPLLIFTGGIILKIILDFNLALFIVKYFDWVPIRSIYRTKPAKIKGVWSQLWDNETSQRYEHCSSRSSEIKIKQFGHYIYGEFRANNDEIYYVFGELIDRNIIGKWRDKKSDLGYYGALELRIIDETHIEGIWLGHSNSNPTQINSNNWKWERNNR